MTHLRKIMRIESQVADHLAAAGKAVDLSQRHGHGQARDRAHSLTNQLNDGPVFFTLLEMIQSPCYGFMPLRPARSIWPSWMESGR